MQRIVSEDMQIGASYPEPTFPLGEIGRAKYDDWCSSLADAGVLSKIALEHINNLSLATDQINAALSAGKGPARYFVEMQRSATLKLEKLIGGLDTGSDAAPSGENPFAQFGFARRAHDRKHP